MSDDIRKRLLREFPDPEYRHAYIESFLDSLIATQIRTHREVRGWTQEELAGLAETTQSAISRYERPDYSAWKLETLRKLAKAFDLALSVKFVSFGDELDDIEQFGEDRLMRPAFASDPVFHGGESVSTASKQTVATLSNIRPFPSSVWVVRITEPDTDAPQPERTHA
jgi:transcriptional regulator with XRE-family HTH domain